RPAGGQERRPSLAIADPYGGLQLGDRRRIARGVRGVALELLELTLERGHLCALLLDRRLAQARPLCVGELLRDRLGLPALEAGEPSRLVGELRLEVGDLATELALGLDRGRDAGLVQRLLALEPALGVGGELPPTCQLLLDLVPYRARVVALAGELVGP